MLPSKIEGSTRTNRVVPSSSLRRILIPVALVCAVVGLEFSFEWVIADAAWRQLALFAMVNVIVALSLNVINGMAGQFSIGHAGFVGIGAYTAAIVAGHVHKALGADEILFSNSFIVMPLALLAAGSTAAVFGFVVGLPSLRLKGKMPPINTNQAVPPVKIKVKK